jgi:hypothetical protein
LKQLVPARTPIVPLKPGGTVLYRAGAASSGCLLVALLTAASDLFRAAGISAPDSAKLALAMAEETVRGFGKSGRKQWIPPSVAAPVQDHAAVRFYRDVLRGAEQYLLLQKATGQGSR